MRDDDCPNILVIVPTYGAFDYARKTLQSMFEHSNKERVAAVVVDDGSPDWHDQWYKDVGGGSIGIINYLNNGGLTKAWNVGFHFAFDQCAEAADFVVATNSDVIFTAGWWRPMVHALEHGWDLVGPLSNAPGASSKGVQDIKRWARGVGTTDTRTSLANVPRIVQKAYGNNVAPCDVNGFFMMAKKSTWLAHAHDAPLHMFPPSIDVMPSGRRNPTPLMTGQEDWLNHRIKKAGGRTGACTGSYIFHYRSVTRGEQHAQGDWHRMKAG